MGRGCLGWLARNFLRAVACWRILLLLVWNFRPERGAQGRCWMERLELALKNFARSARRKRYTITEMPGKRGRAERKEIAASWGNSCPYSKLKPAGTGVVIASTGITSFSC